MITRMLILMLVAVLALPVATLTPPAETSPSPWAEVAVEAKEKKHKKSKKPNRKTVTRTVRQPVTQTFTSGEPITIPAGAPGASSGKAAPYPAAIAVGGFTNGVITDVNLILEDLTHTNAYDVDLLLTLNAGRRALVMSDASSAAATDVDLTLDDEGAASLPELAALSSGTFRPTNFAVTDDIFAAPAPAPNGNVALSVFDGADPNGTWQLWAMDNANGDIGDIGSWSLQITAEADVQVQESAKAKNKKHKKQGKRRR